MKIEIPDEYFSEEELQNTPQRYSRFLNEWLVESQDFTFTTFPAESQEMIIVKDINFFSMCSHHLLPFAGKAHIGYIPNDTICGLSKLSRAVNKFAHRPQIQERLTKQITDYLEEHLKPKGIIVVLEAEHMCMSIRGIRNPGHNTITSAVRGIFLKPEPGKNPKEEFLSLIKN